MNAIDPLLSRRSVRRCARAMLYVDDLDELHTSSSV